MNTLYLKQVKADDRLYREVKIVIPERYANLWKVGGWEMAERTFVNFQGKIITAYWLSSAKYIATVHLMSDGTATVSDLPVSLIPTSVWKRLQSWAKTQPKYFYPDEYRDEYKAYEENYATETWTKF